ncbi:MAG: EAL domain-containing protein [Rhodovulum sp.]|nr:EAL domain-containing protein [Rhodovulum sp.]
MARLGAFFVGLCMALIAGSLGVLMYLYAGTSGAESAVVSLVALTGLAVYNAVALRQSASSGPVADLSRGTADLARQVMDLGRRVAIMESRLDGVLDRVGEAAKPLSDEIGELGSLLTQLAETVATHDTLLRSGAPGSPYATPHAPARPAEPPAAPVVVAHPSAAIAPAVPLAAAVTAPTVAVSSAPAVAPAAPLVPPAAPVLDPPPTGALAGLSREAAAAVVRDAIEAGRIDLLLQPVVMLPQRKVRYYEAVARLRAPDGTVLTPADFLPVAEASGLIARLDNAMLFRCVQVVRRLIGKNRDIGLFCNISAATLADPEFFPQFSEFADANRALAPAFVFEMRQAAYRGLGPIESESLAALADRGFRFSLDHVGDMRFEPRDLADRGFRFVKVSAALLLARTAAPATDIHPADLAGLLGRYGIELIAERIETEAAVVDLLDYEVKLGQGFLFSPPRPVRPEVLQGGPDRIGDLAGALEVRPAGASGAAAPGALAAAPGGGIQAAGIQAAATQAAARPSVPAPASAGTAVVRPAERRPAAPEAAQAATGQARDPGTVLAQIARGMLARK